MLGIGIGFLGVVALTNGDILRLEDGHALGMLAVIGAAACYAVAAVYAKLLLRSEDVLSLTGLKLALGAVLAFGITFTLHGVPDYGVLSLEGGSALVALGVVSTGITFMLYLWLVANAGSVYASLVTYAGGGANLGWAVLGSRSMNTALGAALTALGVAGVMYGPKLASRLGSLRTSVPAAPRPESLSAKEEYA
jgi:drug/metabolite transporter (DMT)-like permease